MSPRSCLTAHTPAVDLDSDEYDEFEVLKAMGGPVVASDANLLRQALRSFAAQMGRKLPVTVFALRYPGRGRKVKAFTPEPKEPAPRPKAIPPRHRPKPSHPWRRRRYPR